MDDHRAAETAMLVLRAATQVADGIHAGSVARGADEDLRPPHRFALARIAAGDATVVDVAAHLGVTKQAASRIVGTLVDRGHLRREPDPGDGRARLLRLTGRGEACHAAAEQAAAEVVNEWAAVLPRASLDAMHAMLRRVTTPGPLRPGR